MIRFFYVGAIKPMLTLFAAILFARIDKIVVYRIEKVVNTFFMLICFFRSFYLKKAHVLLCIVGSSTATESFKVH